MIVSSRELKLSAKACTPAVCRSSRASGSFDLPTGIGTYIFSIDDQTVMANVLDAVHSPPQHSPVSEILITLTSATFSFEVVCGGDLNGDGAVNVTDYTIWAAAYPSALGDPNWNPLGDLNCDEDVDVQDFVIFATRYPGPCP